MNDFSPCDIGEILAWDKQAKVIVTDEGNYPYDKIIVANGYDYVIVQLPNGKFAPVRIGLWEEINARPHH